MGRKDKEDKDLIRRARIAGVKVFLLAMHGPFETKDTRMGKVICLGKA